jgi:putative PIN family toxin of toxin-antitoxin system
MLVVIDTNILVSSLWSKDGAPAKVLEMVLRGNLLLCYDHRILCEYRDVLRRPRFGFSQSEVSAVLGWIENNGRSVIVNISERVFADEADKKFYEVATTCEANLITGNLKHFPKDPLVISVSEFLKKYVPLVP